METVFAANLCRFYRRRRTRGFRMLAHVPRCEIQWIMSINFDNISSIGASHSQQLSIQVYFIFVRSFVRFFHLRFIFLRLSPENERLRGFPFAVILVRLFAFDFFFSALNIQHKTRLNLCYWCFVCIVLRASCFADRPTRMLLFKFSVLLKQ